MRQDEIVSEFEKMTKSKKIEVLYEALDYMSQYNGRSKILCIAMAMGYENHYGEYDTYRKRP